MILAAGTPELALARILSKSIFLVNSLVLTAFDELVWIVKPMCINVFSGSIFKKYIEIRCSQSLTMHIQKSYRKQMFVFSIKRSKC